MSYYVYRVNNILWNQKVVDGTLHEALVLEPSGVDLRAFRSHSRTNFPEGYDSSYLQNQEALI